VRIIFFLRSDANRHVGGAATGQIDGYVRFLKEAGADVTLWRGDREPPGRYDIGHVMNLDWPVEVARQTAAARRRCRRVVLSPVHHRDAWMAQLHRRARAGLARRVAARTSLERFEALRGAALAVRAPRQLPEATRQLALGVRRRQRAVLDAVDLCLTLASGEEDSLAEDFGFDGPTRRVPNSAHGSAAPLPRGLPAEFLLCVARIEARKNHLPLLDAAEALDMPLVLAGPPNTRHRALVRAVEERERSSKGVIWLRELPRAQVLSLYTAAACHVLPSWCEVVAQVDLEAVTAGTRVVTTRHGHMHEYLGEDAVYWDPGSGAEGLAPAVAAALERPLPAPAPGRFDAMENARKLLDAYEAVLGLPEPASARRAAEPVVAA
jgi:glycosyltransferase involved in cell wall biosynthesis